MTRRTNDDDDDDDDDEEETESHFDFSTMEEIDREIERITKKRTSFFSQRSAAANDDDRGDETGKNEKGATTTNEEEEARTSNSKEVRSRARREAVEWRRKKIEEKTFDPRAAFRERGRRRKMAITMMITHGSRRACSCAEGKQKKLLFQPERAGSSWKPNGNCLKRNGKTTATRIETTTKNNNAFCVFATSRFHPPERTS